MSPDRDIDPHFADAVIRKGGAISADKNGASEVPFWPRGGGYSDKVGYAYARTARVWFSPIFVLERVGF